MSNSNAPLRDMLPAGGGCRWCTYKWPTTTFNWKRKQKKSDIENPFIRCIAKCNFVRCVACEMLCALRDTPYTHSHTHC